MSGLSILIGQPSKMLAKKEAVQSKLRDLLTGPKAEEGAESEDGYEVAMQDFIEAVKNSDVKLAMEAFKDVQNLCPMAEDTEDHIQNDDAHSGGVMED